MSNKVKVQVFLKKEKSTKRNKSDNNTHKERKNKHQSPTNAFFVFSFFAGFPQKARKGVGVGERKQQP
jgi:hypothetical protein